MMQIVLVAVAPLLVVAPVLGLEKVESKGERVAEKAKPTVTFYFFDK